MKINRVLAIHDLCSFGRCSLTAAIPVLSALGSQVCPFPTALYSNNLTYGKFHSKDLTDEMTSSMDKWQELGLSFDAIYSGFLASSAQVDVVIDAIGRFACFPCNTHYAQLHRSLSPYGYTLSGEAPDG